MRVGFYPKLAWDGIRKNGRLYLPYIFTGCVMVMMFYILGFLSNTPALQYMKGGSTLSQILPLGCYIIGAFSLLFLFYTNSFLIKQRYREFGLYNILGMDKKNICRVMIWETLFSAIFAVGIGLLLGIVLSKGAELILFNMLGFKVNYDFSIGIPSIFLTCEIYGGIYLLLLLNSIIRVAISKPLELMKSNKVGEKVPKFTWVLAVIGIILLATAYYLAVKINEPLTALIWFFAAVLLVIAGTYLLFIAGSVVFCKLLQKNKKYYYKPNHFVSVSSMVYRMKRNGAGLASICVLLTMVLVMISSTACLYFSAEDSIIARCPNNVQIDVVFNDVKGISDENIDKFKDEIHKYSGSDADLQGIRICETAGFVTDEGIILNIENAEGFTGYSYDRIGYLKVISLDEYNRILNENKTLTDDECLMYCSRIKYNNNLFTVEYGKTYQIKEYLTEMYDDNEAVAMTAPVIYMVINDINEFTKPYADMKLEDNIPLVTFNWRCGFDITDSENEKTVASDLVNLLNMRKDKDENEMYIYYSNIISREECRENFYDLYGSLFFLGIMLSIVFLLAAVLIIYYKQICEGYEDHARFEIMQKIGMTKKDIRRSINSQMLTVFFLPLIMAGLHLGFAFPFISKILMMFSFNNTLLSILVNIGCFAIFGIFYTIVYKITSGAYYSIVSGRKKA